MAGRKKPRLGLLWSQFAPYHIDRCEAVARLLGDIWQVDAIEVASASDRYAWEPSADMADARKVTLFPDQRYERIGVVARFFAQLRALWPCKAVFLGIGYNELDVLALAWVLRLCGKRVILMGDSKFDDRERNAAFELLKAVLLLPYNGAIVAGLRHEQYLRFLGFRRRPILPGYDTVSIERVKRESGGFDCDTVPFDRRDFLYVGRLVEKKNLPILLEGFARHVSQAGSQARRLRIAGSGSAAAEQALREKAAALGIADRVEFLGNLASPQIAGLMAQALCLVLVSSVEQWGLVVNEALALDLPVICSIQVGSRDLLVRNLLNGFIVAHDSVDEIGRAMTDLASNQAVWSEMAACSGARAWMGDVGRFAEAVATILSPDQPPKETLLPRLQAELA